MLFGGCITKHFKWVNITCNICSFHKYSMNIYLPYVCTVLGSGMQPWLRQTVPALKQFRSSGIVINTHILASFLFPFTLSFFLIRAALLHSQSISFISTSLLVPFFRSLNNHPTTTWLQFVISYDFLPFHCFCFSLFKLSKIYYLHYHN